MKKYQYLVERTCPMCKKDTFKKLTREEYNQYASYVCYGDSIQKKLTLSDKFGREFFKTGYCPSCQEVLFNSKLADKSEYFTEDSIRENVVKTFIKEKEKEKMIWSKALQSDIADMLTANEKLLILLELDLMDEFYLDENGQVKVVE